MRDQAVFEISDLGHFRFVVSLAGVEFPYIFVGQRNSDECGTFLFYQIDSDESSVTWAAVQISFEDFDNLNRGKKSVQDCFWGPRRTPIDGYIVKSVSGEEKATCKLVSNIYSYLEDDEPFYPDEFIAEEHGSGPLSMFKNASLFSIVANENRFCLPEMTPARMNDYSENITRMLNSLPFKVNKKPNLCLISDHSFVICFEIVDDKCHDNPQQTKLDLNLEEESEAKAAVKAIKSLMAGNTSEEELVDNFKGNTEALDGFVSFVDSLRRFNKKGIVNVALSSPSEGQEKFRIEKQSVERITETVKKAKTIIKKSEVAQSGILKVRGKFKAVDQTGKTGFKFEPSNGSKMIRGYFECPEKTRDVSYTTNEEYLATFKIIVYKRGSWTSKPITQLVSAEVVSVYKQGSIFDK